MSKPKIALVFSGTQKFYESSLKTINKFQNKFDVFSFCHAWEPSDLLQNYNYSAVKFTLPSNPEKICQQYPNPIYKIEKPENLKSEFDAKFDQIKNKGWKKNSSNFSMFYSMEKADLLRTNYEKTKSIRFTWVVRIRYDTPIKSELDLNQYYNDKIYIPYDHQYAFRTYEQKQPGINDQFAFGPPDLMTKYFDIYKNIVDICNSGSSLCPHAIMAQHLNNKNLPVARPKLDIRINNS